MSSHTRGPLTGRAGWAGSGCWANAAAPTAVTAPAAAPRTLRRVSRSPGSVNRRATLRPRARRLECGRGLQHRQVREPAADDLEPDGQAGRREPGGHRCRGLAGEIERIAERGPANP